MRGWGVHDCTAGDSRTHRAYRTVCTGPHQTVQERELGAGCVYAAVGCVIAQNWGRVILYEWTAALADGSIPQYLDSIML
jgi:hypothetical protein